MMHDGDDKNDKKRNQPAGHVEIVTNDDKDDKNDNKLA